MSPDPRLYKVKRAKADARYVFDFLLQILGGEIVQPYSCVNSR